MAVDIEILPKASVADSLCAALQRVNRAAEGDSNDEEIDALREALGLALTRWPDVTSDGERATIMKLRPARSAGGVRMESAFLYDVKGKGVYNRSYPHRIRVWDNTLRPNPGEGGKYLDPSGRPTDDEVTVRAKAEPVVIAASPAYTDLYADEPLWIGQKVALMLPNGEVLGQYEIRARVAADPELVPVR